MMKNNIIQTLIKQIAKQNKSEKRLLKMANANVENKKVEVLEIKVIVKEYETKEGKKFNAYKAVQNNGKLIDLKFQRVVKNLPEQNCIIRVKPENINIDRTRQFPALWCKKIEEIIASKYDTSYEVIDMFTQPSNPDLPF